MEMNIFKKTLDFGDGKVIELETGRLARQAHGSILLKMNNTMLLATVVSNQDAREGVDFLPLSVDYQEKFASVGRIPGGFLKREGRLSDYEVLICRLVDRALRPLFPKDYHSETQVMISLLSSDEETLPDCLAALAASSAIMLSDLPFSGPVSEVRVGRVEGEFIVNPSVSELANSDIDLMIAGTIDDINMVEGEMDEISEAEMVEALKVGHAYIQQQCLAQKSFRDEVLGENAKIREYSHEEADDEDLEKEVFDKVYDKVYKLASSASNKEGRSEGLRAILDELLEGFNEEETSFGLLKKYYKKAEKKAVRNMVLETKKRLDGRGTKDVRPIWTEIDVLPAPHGSALFTRGETQSLTTVTLGSKLDQQLLDTPMNRGYNNFILHYNFPAFSTGEARPNRGPGRREIGHGHLAMRGLKKMLPEDNAYTIRVVSDILESNGSSSMATVCAGSMALMDTGVKMKKGVSGIAMGMIADSETKQYAILSDILGDEDFLGDMDFKVVGTRDGIIACQMDMKVEGLSYDVLAEALEQSKEGRLHILDEMEKSITEARTDFKPHAPRIEKIVIDKEFIGAVIGPGGKIIQGLQEKTNTVITIEEDNGTGIIEISSPNAEGIAMAKAEISGIVAVPEEGEVYTGVVKNVVEFGAFIEFLPGKQGLLHISEIDWKRLPSMEGVLSEGDELEVKLIGVDARSGKFKLSRKVLLPRPEKKNAEG
jgi:polyribonucleotide nucleotidyltransferase